MRVIHRSMALAAMVAGIATTSWAGQPLEVESARLLKRGGFTIEGGYERQSSISGAEAAVPLAFEYGLSDRLELLVEPVAYAGIYDKGARKVRGIGDLEMTLTTLLSRERRGWPAFALGTEVKVPAAKNIRIGSGKTDYALYLIGSKRMKRWDSHANVGYTFIGRPAGAQTNNVVNFALASEFHASPRFEIVGEVLGVTAALKESSGPVVVSNESQRTPEIGGGELLETLGLKYHAAAWLSYSLGVSIDNQRAVLVHPGLTLSW